MVTAKKCNTCKIRKEIEKSNEPACCIWYMDNVVLGDKSIDDCEIYQDENFDTDEYKQQSPDENCALIKSFKSYCWGLMRNKL